MTKGYYFNGGGIAITEWEGVTVEEWMDNKGYRVAVAPRMTKDGRFTTLLFDTIWEARAYIHVYNNLKKGLKDEQ